jgi:hypothetical protein
MSKTSQTNNLNFEKFIVSVLSSTTKQSPKQIRQFLDNTVNSTNPLCDTHVTTTPTSIA